MQLRPSSSGCAHAHARTLLGLVSTHTHAHAHAHARTHTRTHSTGAGEQTAGAEGRSPGVCRLPSGPPALPITYRLKRIWWQEEVHLRVPQDPRGHGAKRPWGHGAMGGQGRLFCTMSLSEPACQKQRGQLLQQQWGWGSRALLTSRCASSSFLRCSSTCCAASCAAWSSRCCARTWVCRTGAPCTSQTHVTQAEACSPSQQIWLSVLINHHLNKFLGGQAGQGRAGQRRAELATAQMKVDERRIEEQAGKLVGMQCYQAFGQAGLKTAWQ